MALDLLRLRLRERTAGRDAGVTLMEMMVTMVLLLVVSALVMTAFISTSRSLRHNDDEAQGLADVKKVVERLGRDIRNARSVASGADASHLVLWIDENSDYVQQSSENVTWQLQTGTTTGHYDVVRIKNTVTVIEANTLISNIAFTYDATAPATRLVTTSVAYDPKVGSGSGARVVNFGERLRNVA